MSRPPFVSSRVLRREITSRFEEVDAVCADIRAFLQENDLSARSFAIELMARECLNNAVLHGNRDQPGKKATLSLQLGKRWLRLEIADEGHGFNWRRARSKAADPAATSGRGLIIGTLYADRLAFSRSGNRITLWLDKLGKAKRH